MSHYPDARYRSRQERDSRAGYVEDDYVESRGGRGNRQMELAYHHNDSEGSIEEVTRDYPPGEYGYGYDYPRHGKVTTVREGVRRTRSDGARDPYYGSKSHRSDNHRQSKRYHDNHDRYVRRSSYSRSPSPQPRRKSLSEQALGVLGLDGMLGSSASKHHRGRSHGRGGHRRNRSYSYSSSRSRDGRNHGKGEERIGHAIKAALAAGATEAIRASKSSGGWTGEKGKRILTAAITAGGVDGFRDPDKKKKSGVIGSALTGLAANRILNGPRDKSRSRSRGGRRDRSQSRGGLKDLAATGILTAAGKEVFDRIRSRSKSRGRDRSYDSDSPSRRHSKKKRSHSVSAYVSKGLAVLGLDEGSGGGGRHRQGRSSRYSDESDDESEDDYYQSRRHGGSSRDVGRFRSQADGPNASPESSRDRGLSTGKHAASRGSKSDSDSDLGCSSEDDRKRKKIRKNEMLAAGFAAVATINAAHSIKKSVDQRKKRQQQLEDGEISPEEARKRKIKSNVWDAASVGLAALGIQEVVSEWKETRELIGEHKHFREKAKERAQKRALRRARSHDSYDRDEYR